MSNPASATSAYGDPIAPPNNGSSNSNSSMSFSHTGSSPAPPLELMTPRAGASLGLWHDLSSASALPRSSQFYPNAAGQMGDLGSYPGHQRSLEFQLDPYGQLASSPRYSPSSDSITSSTSTTSITFTDTTLFPHHTQQHQQQQSSNVGGAGAVPSLRLPSLSSLLSHTSGTTDALDLSPSSNSTLSSGSDSASASPAGRSSSSSSKPHRGSSKLPRPQQIATASKEEQFSLFPSHTDMHLWPHMQPNVAATLGANRRVTLEQAQKLELDTGLFEARYNPLVAAAALAAQQQQQQQQQQPPPPPGSPSFPPFIATTHQRSSIGISSIPPRAPSGYDLPQSLAQLTSLVAHHDGSSTGTNNNNSSNNNNDGFLYRFPTLTMPDVAPATAPAAAAAAANPSTVSADMWTALMLASRRNGWPLPSASPTTTTTTTAAPNSDLSTMFPQQLSSFNAPSTSPYASLPPLHSGPMATHHLHPGMFSSLHPQSLQGLQERLMSMPMGPYASPLLNTSAGAAAASRDPAAAAAATHSALMQLSGAMGLPFLPRHSLPPAFPHGVALPPTNAAAAVTARPSSATSSPQRLAQLPRQRSVSASTIPTDVESSHSDTATSDSHHSWGPRSTGTRKRTAPAKPRARRSFVCDMCGRSFRANWGLERHLRIHYDDRRFKCSKKGCNASFTDASNCKRHEEMVPHADPDLEEAMAEDVAVMTGAADNDKTEGVTAAKEQQRTAAAAATAAAEAMEEEQEQEQEVTVKTEPQEEEKAMSADQKPTAAQERSGVSDDTEANE